MEPNPTFNESSRAGGSRTGVRFPGEDDWNSLAQMAQRDLDAALQLLADRAQYITGAGGAAVALRRSGKNDMLCRASSGPNAPELGMLLSTELGLSGESVCTRKPLCCDDAQRDPRVNPEVCRQMGIASVVVMPVVQDDEVLGVFELFSGKAHAFSERDLSALQRLSEMVGTAVRLARATEELPERLKTAEAAEESATVKSLDVPRVELDAELVRGGKAEAAPESAAEKVTALPLPQAAPRQDAPPAKLLPPLRPLFWSAAPNTSAEPPRTVDPDQSHVPPVLRNLRKCAACGFPVSAGRVLCVECEEKKWRVQLRVPHAGEAK